MGLSADFTLTSAHTHVPSQIVRTDLKELIDMDLKGAPYAYAPMGDDRPEMEGFRFWKTGYWKGREQLSCDAPLTSADLPARH